MDPNQGGQKTLNPNLQAAYDRVMGLDVSGNATTSQPTTPTPPTTPPSQPVAPTPPPATPAEPTAPVAPTVPTVNPEPPMPSLPTTPITPPTEPMSPTPPVPTPPAAAEDTAPPTPSMDAMNAAMNMPQVIPHDTETVKIGLGGSPVGSVAKAKGKGLSPTILILGAFVFLMVYALFWVRFFNLPLPFLGK